MEYNVFIGKLNSKLQSYTKPIILQTYDTGLKRLTDPFKVKTDLSQNLDYISVPLILSNVLSTEYRYVIPSRYVLI